MRKNFDRQIKIAIWNMSIGKCVQLCFSLYVCLYAALDRVLPFFFCCCLSFCLVTFDRCDASYWRNAFIFFCLTFDWSECKFNWTQWYRTCNAFQRSLKYSGPFFLHAFVKTACALCNKFDWMRHDLHFKLKRVQCIIVIVALESFSFLLNRIHVFPHQIYYWLDLWRKNKNSAALTKQGSFSF